MAGSPITRPFIWERMSRSCGVGRVERVLEIASGQVRLGARSAPGGNGGSPFAGAGGGAVAFVPFDGGASCCGCWVDVVPLSSLPP